MFGAANPRPVDRSLPDDGMGGRYACRVDTSRRDPSFVLETEPVVCPRLSVERRR